MATLLITKGSIGQFSFVLNGDYSNEVKNIRNDLTTVGIESHFKTANGANLIKNQQIYPADVTIIDGSTTLNPSTVNELFSMLQSVGYFDWISGFGGGGGGVTRFDQLLDTPDYFGNDGKTMVVDEAQMKLIAVDFYNYNKFTQLEDAPNALVANKYLKVNTDGTEIILVDLPPAPTDPNALPSGGYVGTGSDLADSISNIGADIYAELLLKEDTGNKQDSLIVDGTGTKFPTVDAVNEGLSNIFQPNQLISSVAPTRSVNTFTYPATQYTALISGTIRTNPAQFITTISPATTDYKRVDLIYFKSDNTLDKVIGVESLTVAVRPDVPANAVAISFINVFGNVVEAPTPVTQEISIQDSLGVQKFPITDYIRFKGASFNAAAKQIEIDPLIGGAIFVSSTGNDTTAEIENKNKPFLTLNAAISAYWNNPNIDYILVDSATTFVISVALNNGTVRKLDIRSEKACIINVTYNGHYGFLNQIINVDLKLGTINFAPTTTSLATFSTSSATINANVVSFSANYDPEINVNSNFLTITSNILNINCLKGLVACTGGNKNLTVNSKTINFTGANTRLSGAKVDLILNFDLIVHNNSFFLNHSNGNSSIISHGSVSSIAPYVNTTNIKYILGKNTTIQYKTGSVINSNLSIDRFNVIGSLNLSGVVNYVNSNYLIISNNAAVGVTIIDCTIKCKKLVGSLGYTVQTIKIINSYIELTSDVLVDFDVNVDSVTYPNPTFQFEGQVFIIANTTGLNLANKWTGVKVPTNIPTFEFLKGELRTNGKIDRSFINIVEAPLNQYYDSTQRQLVLVDEKEEIVNKVLDPTKTYIINGIIPLSTGDFILEPAGGLTIGGYGFNTSGFTKNTAGESIIKSTVGGSGDLTLKDMFFQSGAGSVFDLTDVNGQHAIEMNDVNFNNCASLGVISGYRQLTGQTIGIYGCSNGLTVAGTWNGFSMAKLHVRSFGITGTLFKKGLSATFSNRFSLGVNISSNTGYKLLDFDNTMFSKDRTLQISDSTIEVAGVIDPSNTLALIPNILPNDPKCKWYNSEGITLTALEFLDMKSPDGNIWRVSVSNAGALVLTDI